MKNNRHIFTSESVTEGHPDKMADQISDAVLDAVLADDPQGRVACETLLTTGLVVVAGEITTTTYIDIPKIVRETIKQIGYNDPNFGFDYQGCGVITSIDEQSPDIAMGVDEKKNKAQGAGDQGLMFGYADRETPEYMPMPIILAHKLAKKLAEVRKRKVLDYLRPDGKTEVAVEYNEQGKPQRLETVVIATQHNPEVSLAQIKKDLIKEVIEPICGDLLDRRTKIYVNATGKFILGGPPADTGLTGRKIIVDTYGGHGSHGGGAFSGKDPSKVDRSASYMARYVAKNVVAARLADKCEVQLAYVIGVPEPISIMVNTFGTGKYTSAQISQAIREVFPLDPAGIIKELDLRRPIFKKTAAYGHFGRREKDFTWEKTNKVKDLKAALK